MRFSLPAPHTEHPPQPTAVFKSSLMMEVDMQSPPPPFRPVPFTIKRPRSPGSPTQERQSKRPSLVPIASEGPHTRRTSTTPEGAVDSCTTNQDDWVRQARELSIASPLSVTVGFSSESEARHSAHGRIDEHMAIDCDDPQGLRVHVHPGGSRPWSTRTHLPSIHISTTSPGLCAQSPAPFSVLTEPPTSSTGSAPSTASISGMSTHRPPDIFLFPATPSDTPSHQHQFTTDYGQQAGESERGTHTRMPDQGLAQSVLTRGQDRTEGSPRPSRTADIPTSSGRKHRVMMGPRADCVKCRTGVRGHWMHFD